jgi:hypothetical protein
MRTRTDSLVRIAIALLATLADRDAPTRATPPRLNFGVALQVMQGVGAFADSVDAGIGVGFNGRYDLDARRIFALRADVGYQIYGNERKRIPFPTAPRITLEQNTNNTILSYSVGPQFMWPTGFVGGSYFATQSTLEGSSNDGAPFASSENFYDNVFSYGGGGGVLIPFRTRRTPVALDIGARYVHNGTARYLKPGSIVDNGDTYTVTPIEGPANFVVYTIGVSIGAVRHDRRRGY